MMHKMLTFILPIAGCSMLIAAPGVIAAGLAKEGSFETIICYAGPIKLTAVGKVWGAILDVVGTPMAKEGELLYGTSARVVDYSTNVGKEQTDDASSLFTDSDGDQFLFMYSGRYPIGMPGPGTWKAVAGTGKYEGMEASGTYVHVNQPAKSARTDWYNGCDRDSGHWKLK
jgi:hypothetical protein